jgi:hypothetical protein
LPRTLQNPGAKKEPKSEFDPEVVAEAAAAAEQLETGKPKWHALLELLRIPDDKASLRLLEGQGDVHRSESAPLYHALRR